MIENIIKKIFGTKNDREIKRINIIVEKINSYESTYLKYSDEELKNNTLLFKERVKNGETLEEL